MFKHALNSRPELIQVIIYKTDFKCPVIINLCAPTWIFVDICNNCNFVFALIRFIMENLIQNLNHTISNPPANVLFLDAKKRGRPKKEGENFAPAFPAKHKLHGMFFNQNLCIQT